MTVKKWIITALCMVVNTLLIAQNESDVLRYSFYDFQGTARYIAMGGAFGALGGDLSSITQNPAGLAIYRKGEFSFSPGLLINNSTSTYNGLTSKDSKPNFNLGNIGFVAALPSEKEGAIKFFHFGINYNRLKDFHHHYTISGENSSSSLSDVFANLSNGIPSENLLETLPFSGGLAWETYLIDPVPGSMNEYVSVFPGGNVRQTKNIETRGRSTQTDLAFGFNAEDMFYMGVSIGILGVFYEENSVYSEEILEENVTDLEDFNFRENLEIEGNGINFNVGAIVRLTDAFRLGLAYHSPKWYNLEDTWSTRLITNFENGENYDEGSVTGFNTYRVNTPYRLVGSAAYVVGKNGIISADYEYIDYSTSKLKPDGLSPSDFSNANNEIALQYGPAHNVRVGGELRFLPYSLRAGVSMYDTPFNQGFSIEDGTRYSFSLGGGVKWGNKYLDMAYRYTTFNSDYYFYDPDLVNAASLANHDNQIRFTLGIKF